MSEAEKVAYDALNEWDATPREPQYPSQNAASRATAVVAALSDAGMLADPEYEQIRAVAAECSVVLYSGSSDCCVWCGNHGEADTDEFCSLASLLAALLPPVIAEQQKDEKK